MQPQEAIIHLLLKQPFYGHIASALTFAPHSGIPTMKTLTSPHLHILYNPEWYGALVARAAIGVLIHELLHLILLHPLRRGAREVLLWSVACDLAVNGHIHGDLLPADAITVTKVEQELKITLEPMKSAETYYAILEKTENGLNLLQLEDQVKILLSSGETLSAELQDSHPSAEMDRKTVEKMISDCVTEASEDGDAPDSLADFISDNYKAYRVNWRNVLKRFLSGKGRMISRKSLKKVSRRFENMPGNKRTLGLHVLLALDESGSINGEELKLFWQEILKIKRITGASLSVTEFDTRCSEPIPIERYARNMKRRKSGGTDFRPIFTLADAIRVPMVIVFTDGDGSMPEAVNQKVLWVLTREPKKPVPFGHSIVYEQE